LMLCGSGIVPGRFTGRSSVNFTESVEVIE